MTTSVERADIFFAFHLPRNAPSMWWSPRTKQKFNGPQDNLTSPGPAKDARQKWKPLSTAGSVWCFDEKPGFAFVRARERLFGYLRWSSTRASTSAETA